MIQENLLLLALQKNDMNLLDDVLKKNNKKVLLLLNNVDVFIELVKCNNNVILRKIADIPNYKYSYLILQFININEKIIE
jgi:hypothetical protein